MAALQALGNDFAMAWAHAATQQRWNDRAAYIQQKENNKSAWDTATGWVFGDNTDKNTENPPNVEVPSPPGFDATANPVRYVGASMVSRSLVLFRTCQNVPWNR